jgi:hypothetical protein
MQKKLKISSPRLMWISVSADYIWSSGRFFLSRVVRSNEIESGSVKKFYEAKQKKIISWITFKKETIEKKRVFPPSDRRDQESDMEKLLCVRENR